MPASNTDSGARAVQPRRRKKPQPTPTPRGVTGAFGGASSQKPFAGQQQQAATRTRRAAARLPAPTIAAPPVIPNPTRAQTQHAARQISHSITRIVGSKGSAQERIARRDAILDRVVSDPRLAATRASLQHWSTEQAKLNVPGQRVDTVKAGTGPKKVRLGVGPLSLATVNLTAASRGLGSALAAAAPGIHAGSAEAQFARNAFSDVGTLATAPVVGAIGLGGVAKDVVTGHPGRAADKAAAFGKGVVQGTIRDWSHPGQYLREHPLLFALDVAGATAVAGRTAGAIARGVGSQAELGGVRGALARGGSTVRPPLALSDDPAAPLVSRTYSKDLTRKTAQVAADATREPLKRPDGSVVTTTDRGRQVPVLKAKARPTLRHPTGERGAALKGAADTDASRANSVERMVRDKVSHEMKVHGIKGQRAKDLVSMVVEGTITSAKHFDEDLKVERDRIAGYLDEHERTGEVYRDKAELAAAQAKVKLIDDARANPKIAAQAEKIVSTGVEIGGKLNAEERKAIALGLLDPKRARRARLIVPAIAHVGARYFHEDELKAMERAGVEVRDPAKVATHKAAQDAAASAQREARDADKLVQRLVAKRNRLVGAQASRRGTRQKAALGNDLKSRTGERVEGRATPAEQRKLAKLTEDLASARRAARQKRQAMSKAQRTARRTPKPPLRAALRGPDGRFLPNTEIEDFLKSRGRDPETVAYLPHRLDTRGARAFHAGFRPGNRGTMDAGETRTGSAYAKGVTESSANLIREQGVRQRVQIAKAQALDRMVGDMGMKRPDGAYWTSKEALEVAKRLKNDDGEMVVPVRAFAAKLDPETRRMIREDLQGPGAMDSLGQRLLNDRVVREGVPGDEGARNVVLVPADYVQRLEKHLRPAGEITKLFQIINRPFRFAVLATNRWLFGNFVEPYIVRLTVNGSGLNVFGLGMDITAATKLIRLGERSSDPRVRRAAEELRGQQLGGLGVGGRGLSVRREATDLESGQLISQLPVVGQGFEILRSVGHALMAPGNLYFRVNRAIENVAQRAALGRDVRRDLQEFTGSWTKTLSLHKAALDDVMKGLVDTPAQRRFMRSQHEILGKYEGYPPWLRTLIQGPLPFIPWMLNAARFTLWTMPAHHTALTALLVKVNDVMAKDWKEIHANVPPGSLKFAVPTKDGGWLDLARYTPYGLTTPIVGSEGKDWQSVTDQFLPQASSAVAAFTKGEDPFGRDLQLDPTENQGVKEPDLAQRLGIALYGLAESNTPYLSQARRVREGGGTAYAGSTILDPDTKPGTVRGQGGARGGLNRTLNPLRPTYLGAGGSTPVAEPSQASSHRGLPPSVQRVLRANAAVQHAGQLPASVQRALRQVR